MTKAEREMMERIYAYGIILSLDEERAGRGGEKALISALRALKMCAKK